MRPVPLHVEVLLPCPCCGLATTMTLRSETDQRWCEMCEKHGQDAERVRSLHRDAVIERETVLRRLNVKAASDLWDSNKRAGELEATIASEFDIAPPDGALEGIRSAVVSSALSRRDAAYRSRDTVMGDLWRALRLHRIGQKPTKCICGKLVGDCRELQAISDAAITVQRWEAQQLDRLAQGQDHSLPRDHPKVVERRPRFA